MIGPSQSTKSGKRYKTKCNIMFVRNDGVALDFLKMPCHIYFHYACHFPSGVKTSWN